MSKIVTNKVVEKGNFDLYFQKRTNDVLLGDVVHVQGLISVDLTFSQETTNTAADDVPDFVSMTAPLTVEGTLTILSMSLSDYEKLYTIYTDDNGIHWLGTNTQADKVGYAYKTTVTDALGVQSNNMLSFPNTTISLPSKTSVTVDEDGGEISNVEIPVNSNPVFWVDSLGMRQRSPAGFVNSVDDPEIWAKVKDTVFLPNMAMPIM